MNTILLQKILDILTEGLAHVGDFFKDLFISDPQDGQVIAYDADSGEWKNMSIAELSLDVTDTVGPADIINFSDAADMPLKALVANINVEGGTNEVNVTHAGKNIWDETYTDIGSTVTYKQIKTGPGTFTFSTDEPKNTDNASNLFAIGSYATSGGSTNVNGVWNGQSRTVTTDGYITIAYRKTLNNSPEDYHTQIEVGDQATTYEAYTGATETVTLPSSVANGYVDVISGAGMNTDTSLDMVGNE